MRRRVGRTFAAVLALLAGCKGDPSSAPRASTLSVQIETKTCASAGTVNIDVFIDHTLVGSPALMVGTTATYVVTPGDHILGGVDIDRRFSWASETVTVPVGGDYTAQFACSSPGSVSEIKRAR
jgi:hypothetical protein